MEDLTDAPVQTDIPATDQPPPKLSVDQFAEKIKAKYPDYANVDNADLVKRITEKYPDYNNQIDYSQKKSPVGTPGLPNGGLNLSNGLNPFQSSPASTPYSNITTSPQAAQQLAVQQQQVQPPTNPVTNNNLQDYMKSLTPDEQKAITNATQQSQQLHSGDSLTDTPLQQQGDYNYAQTLPGKIQNSLTYLAQKATKGGLQVVKGAAYLAQLGANINSGLGQTDTHDFDSAFQSADNATNFLPKTSELQVENNKVISNLGGLAEFLPAAAAAEGTGGATLYLQMTGQGKELADNAEANGVKLNPTVKNAFILGYGAVGGYLMHGAGSAVFKSLGTGVKNDVVSEITANAIKEAAGKDLTAETWNNMLQSGAKDWEDKALQGGANFLQNTQHAITNLTALKVSDFALKKGADIANEATGGQSVFNESPGSLPEGIGDAIKTGIAFGATGSLGDISKLTPFSQYRNTTMENLIADPSNDNIAKTKDLIAQHGTQEGWSPDEIQATQAHIDQIGKVVQSIPKSLPDDKKQQAIDLIINRNDLQKQLTDVQQQTGQLDPAFQGVANNGQILIDKIDQANDKLKTLVTGDRTTYSKGIDEDEGKFFKTTNGVKEEITPQRYDLESLERDAKSKAKANQIVDDAGGIPLDKAKEILAKNEQAEPNPQVPATPPADETAGTGEVTTLVNETAGDNQVNQPIEPGVPEKIPNEDTIKVNEILDKPVIYKGEPAIVTQDGQSLVAKIKNSNREYELGNVDDIGDMSIKDLGIEHQNSIVDTDEDGNILVRGKKLINNYSDPKAAINTDNEGNVVSVNLETTDGEKRTFRGDIAEDIAYQIHLKELNKDNETKQQFEQFAGEHEPTKSAVVAAENENTAKVGTVEDNAEVPTESGGEVKRIKVKLPEKDVKSEPILKQEEKPIEQKKHEPVLETAQGEPPAKVEPELTEEEGGTEVKKTILTKRAYEGDISDDVKKYLEDKGLTRTSFSQEERSKQATDFINKFGEDAALHAVKSGDIDGGMAASILAQLQIRNSHAMSDLPEGSDEREELAKKQADNIATMEKKGYLGGEFNGQLAHEYENAELDYANVKRQVEKSQGKPLTEGQEKKVKDLTDENERLKSKLQESESKLIEETDKAFKAGGEAVKDETKAQKAKRIADKLRDNAKIHRPGVFNSATPATLIWDAAVEVTAKSIEVGGKLADAIDAGIKHIQESDWYKGLPTNKKALAEKEFKRFNNDKSGSTDLADLQARFADKQGNKFTPDEAKDIWGYMKSTYIENGVSYKDAMSKTSEDLGLSWRQVSEAVTTPKTKRMSDDMWKRQADLARYRSTVKNWIGDQDKSIAGKALQKVSGLFRGVAVFGHGGIFIGTHAGMTLFNPSTWSKVIPAFFRGWKFAYGNEGDYQRSIEELKNSPNYVIAQRAGLNNNPERINAEEYQKSQKYLGKLGLAGEKGFNAIKVLRQDLFDYHFNKLTPAERDDPSVAKSIAHLVNLATGATTVKIPSWVNEVSFAGGMEASRWEKLTASPAKATSVALNAIFNPDKASAADRVFAKVWARRVGEQVATYSALLLANAAIQNSINPKNKVNMTNPNKPDFLKFKFGDVTIDPTSGMHSTAAFIYKLGKIPFEPKNELHGDRGTKVAGKDIASYARGKLAPLYSTIADFYESQDFNGNTMPYSNAKPASYAHKLNWGEYGTSKLPLPVAEAFGVFYQSALTHGAHKKTLDNVLKGIMSGAISGTTGLRVGEYDANAPENKKK